MRVSPITNHSCKRNSNLKASKCKGNISFKKFFKNKDEILDNLPLAAAGDKFIKQEIDMTLIPGLTMCWGGDTDYRGKIYAELDEEWINEHPWCKEDYDRLRRLVDPETGKKIDHSPSHLEDPKIYRKFIGIVRMINILYNPEDGSPILNDPEDEISRAPRKEEEYTSELKKLGYDWRY